MKQTVELDTNCTLTLMVYDEQTDWSCRLEKWFSQYMDEWYTGITVYDEDRKERLHAGMSDVEFSKESALAHLETAKKMVGM